MSDNMRLTPAEGVWVVRAEGGVVAESRNAWLLQEGEATSTVYFPPADVATTFLVDSDTRYVCPVKGEAAYFHISAPGGRIEDAAWSYAAPPDAIAAIAEHIAFDAHLVAVERL